MKKLIAATVAAALIAGPSLAQSQLYQEAQMNLRELGIEIEIPEDTDPAKLEQVIQATEHAGPVKEATESQVKEILGME